MYYGEEKSWTATSTRFINLGGWKTLISTRASNGVSRLTDQPRDSRQKIKLLKTVVIVLMVNYGSNRFLRLRRHV